MVKDSRFEDIMTYQNC